MVGRDSANWHEIIVTGMAIVIVGCTGSSSGTPTLQEPESLDISGAEVEDLSSAETYDFARGSDGLDVGTETFISAGEPGYACASSADCFSGFCIATPHGSKCTMECLDECPFGWSCTLHKPSLPDTTFICSPTLMNLCRPCMTNGDCSVNGVDLGDTCLPRGNDGNFCGGNCDSNGCPPGYACLQALDVHGGYSSQCVVTDGACSCADWFVDDAASTTCQVESEWGTCQGERTCAAGGLTPCSAAVPVAETCNGADDNCDGNVDEGDDWGPCTNENEFGSCPGTYSCQTGSLVCDGLEPAGEDCDGLDNNCDGQVDEGFPNTDSDDDADCVDDDDDGDGDPDSSDCLPLEASVFHGAEETCNGEDDNCSGSVDEGFIDTDFDGLKDCVDDDDDNDGDPDQDDCQQLNPLVHHGTQETCDGVDEDCDDEVDEELGELECGLGECFHQVPLCEDGELQSCNPFEGSSEELCDGIDNNCNGSHDEGFSVGQPCIAGIGLCAVEGTLVCKTDGASTDCSAEPLEPDCTDKECGDNGCGGQCGQCPGPNYLCIAASCVCQPDCFLKTCGDDGCGGSCGTCSALESCNDGVCNGCDDGNNIPMDGCTGGQISEFLVNTEVSSNQQAPDVSVLADGGYVIVWESEGQDGDGMGIFGQRYGPDGMEAGEEFQVNEDSYLNQEDAEVAGLDDGGFVVVWQSEEFNLENDDYASVFARLYDASGDAATDEFRVHDALTYWQRAPSISSLENGGFVVTWQHDGPGVPSYPDAGGIYARLFSADATADELEFGVNTYVTNKQERPSVARANGGFIVSWESLDQDVYGYGVFVQRFASDGATVGSESRANEFVLGDQWVSRTCGLSDGRSVVLWQGTGSVGAQGDVYYSQFDDEGMAISKDWLANTVTAKIQRAGALSPLPDGGFVIAWESWGQGAVLGASIYMQRFDGKGSKSGLDFKANSESGDMRGPRLDTFQDGALIVAWDNLYDDGSGRGVFAQRFASEGYRLYH